MNIKGRKGKKRNGKLKVSKDVKKYIAKKFDKMIEDKMNTGIVTASAITNTLNGVLLNGIGQGDDYFQRTGVRIRSKYIHVNAVFRYPAANTPTSPIVIRFMIVRDIQANQTSTVDGDLLQVATAGSSYISHENWQNRDRFKIYYDRLITLQPQSASIGTNGMVAIKAYVPLHLVQTAYSGVGTTVASIETGALAMFVVSNVAAGGANSAEWAYEYKHVYEDA